MEAGVLELVAVLLTSAVGGGVGGGGMVRYVLNGMRQDVREIRTDMADTRERVVKLEVRADDAERPGDGGRDA